MNLAEDQSLPRYVAIDASIIDDEYIIGLEKLEDVVDEGFKLGQQQVAELFPDISSEEGVKALANNIFTHIGNATVMLVTFRHKLDLVGYIVYSMEPFTHNPDVMAAVEKAAYVLPEYRQGTKFTKMLKFAEEAAHFLGAGVITITNRGPADGIGAGPNIAPLCERKGYKPFAVDYVKEI